MPHLDPTLSIAERVDATCDRFEQEWRAGRRPRVEDYVAAALESDREELRRQLLALEQELQAQGAADTSVSRSSVREEPSPALGRTIDYVEASDLSRQTIGRFQIHGKLGHGAFGQVYRAFDPDLGREVAIKVPLETALASPGDRERFLKEARAAATINHPNICQIHEVGEHDGRPYIVMALVNGQSLADHLKSRKEPISEKQAAMIVRKVALALAAAHDKGIVHRDLKPANIMFDRERKDVIVMDFGLARGPRMGDARGTQSGVIMGTPAYMSPEQASGGSKDVGPAGDIYSLGVVLYELLTGTRPFKGTATEVIGQILHVEPEKPSQRRTGIDPRLESICLKAMAKRPEERFASMKEMAAAIDAVLRTPQPTSSSAETMQPAATRRDGAEATSSENMTDLFAVMSMERKATRAETAAVVEAALSKHRTPRWVFVAIGLVMLFGFIALGGIIFFTRTPTATVMINIDVDLNDKTLSFFLDGNQVSPESLQSPIELKVGTHELVVKRGEEIVRKFTFTVSRDAGPRIELREETPKKQPTPPGPAWTPLIQSAEDLVEGTTISKNDASRSVAFRAGKLELRGNGAFFRPPFTGKNYVVRARIHEFVGQNVLFRVRLQPNGGAGYGGFFHWGDRNLDWPTCGIGKVPGGGAWEDKVISLKRVSNTLPVEFAVAVHGSNLTVYMNGEQMAAWSDAEFAEGAAAFRLTGDGRVVLSDLAVCALDGTSFAPTDVLPQVEDPEIRRRLSPEFLTKELQARNLLKNGNFEAGDTNGWKFESWRNNKSSVAVVEDIVRTGRKALRIRANQNDSIELKQTVKVSPNRWYLLSGWIKTQNLKFWERDHQGAHLYVWGHHRHQSKSLPAKADWTYFAVIFDSGRRQRVDVAARLGAFAGTMTGTAWFDDLCLVELPDNIAALDDFTLWQGMWRCVAEHSRGKRLTDEELKQRSTIMRIEGNRREVERTLDGQFSRYGGTFQLNSAKSPREFDYDDDQRQGPRNYHRGVYEFDGERLRLIYRHAQGTVPQRAGWNDIGQPNVVWFEFERVSEDPDRKLAEWLLSLNPLPGPQRAVFVATGDGEQRRLDDVKLLPSGKFRVTQIDTWGNKNVTDANVDPILKWLERSKVDTISFHGNAIGDATVEKLVKIKTLKSIWLGGTKITDRSLELLASRPDLRLTGFDGTKITDAGVAQLARMTELESLSFYNTALTDEGLKHLIGLKKLRILGLGVTKITPQGLRLLKELPIERLNIISCHPVASELKVLKEFPRLGHLEASGLKLIDRDADLLAELQTLETLALNHNRLTDDGLQKLTALKNLKELAIWDNPVTAEGVAKFQKALPKCVVHWDKK